jgi:hypothetical protein
LKKEEEVNMMPNTSCPIMELPDYLIVRFFNHTSTRDLCQIEQCSKGFKRIVTEAFNYRINDFLAYFKEFQTSNVQTLGGRVIKKWLEMGRSLAIEYEKTGVVSGRQVGKFYSLKSLFIDSTFNEDLSVDSFYKFKKKFRISNPNHKIPTFLLEIFSKPSRARNCENCTPNSELQRYSNVLISETQIKQEALPLWEKGQMITVAEAFEEFVKVDIALPIGRTEATTRLMALAQENVCVFRKSSQPGDFAISAVLKGRTMFHIVIEESFVCRNYVGYYRKMQEDTNFKKFLVEAEQELKIDPTQRKQKKSLQEHQERCATLASEIMSLPIYIKKMNRKGAEDCLRKGEYCIRNSSSRNLHGNSEFALSYKLTDGQTIHHLITVDDYGRVIINEIPYSSIQEFLTKGKQNGFLKYPYSATYYPTDGYDLMKS